MTERVKYRPFTGTSDKSIHLNEAPLELVLCQLRWPELSSLQGVDRLHAAALTFGEKLDDYPLFSESKGTNYVITLDGVTSTEAGTIYQWTSLDDVWRISLAQQFMTICCTTYPGYESFDDRLRTLIGLLRSVVQVPIIDRVGVRYVNRLTAEKDIKDLHSLVRTEVLGFSALYIGQPDVFLENSTSQAAYKVNDAILQVRSGILPPGQTVDPVIKPLSTQTWVLDLDASRESRQILDVETIAATASRMSDVAYDYFKFVATEKFIQRFRGEDDDHL